MKSLSLDTTTLAARQRSVSFIMLQVIIALTPGIVVYALFIDKQILIKLTLAVLCALLFESVLVKLRSRSVAQAIKDLSIVLASVLLALSLPQTLPIWQLIFGVFILCTLGKHVFGGLGHNPFNPAMVAYAVLIISFPQTMTQWNTDLGLFDSSPQSIISHTDIQAEQTTDNTNGITRATPLDRLHAESLVYDGENATDESPLTPIITEQTKADKVMDSDWLWLNVAWLLGGIYLLMRRIISWHIPASVLSTAFTMYLVFGLLSSQSFLPAHIAIVSGAIIFGAFFIATDPVSSASSNAGKLVYGIGIGVFCFFIREFSAYPEGMAFGILLMNMMVPLIDHSFRRTAAIPNDPAQQ